MLRTTSVPGSSSIPRAPGRLIARTRLLRRLDAMTPLTIVRGLSGTGKSTLVAQWARERLGKGDTVAWYNAADLPPTVSIPRAITPSVLEAPNRLVVVIDDAHFLIDETDIDQLCRLLTVHERMHLVVCTRVSHPIKETARSHAIAMTVLTGKNLNSDVAELPSLAHSWGHSISQQQATDLIADVGGWLAPTRIALDAADPTHDPTGVLAVRQHLREQILPQLTDQASLLIAMTLAAADEVAEDQVRTLFIDDPHTPNLLAPHDPVSTIEHFERHGLLERSFAAGGDRHWHFPRLIRRALADMFVSEHPDEAAHTHQVLARHLSSAQDPALSGRIVRHARAGGDWALLSRMWTLHGLRLTTDHPEAVLIAYDEIPAIATSEYPALALAASVIASLQAHHDPHQRAALLTSYADAGWALRAANRSGGPTDSDIMGIASQIIADRVGGDPQAAVQRAEAHAGDWDSDSTHASSLTARAWFELHWALSSFAAGHGVTAMQLFTKTARTAAPAGADFIVSAALAQRGLMNAIAGHTREAGEDLAAHQRIDTSGQWLHHTITVASHIARGILQLDQLDSAAADHLAQAGDGTDSIEEWALLTWANTQYALLFGNPIVTLAEVNHVAALHHGLTRSRARDQRSIERSVAELLLALGELNRAKRHIDDAGDQLTLAVPRARLALISGDYSQARSIAVASAWQPGMMLRDRADLLMIKAAAALEMDDEDAAVVAFTRAHSLANSVNTLLPYIALPYETLTRLLERSRITLPPKTSDLIAARPAVYPSASELITLTPREATILYAMVQHETLADIAKALTVSLNTVKKQAAAVYLKLGVHDRAAALLQAHRLGLLPEPTPRNGPPQVIQVSS